MDLLLRAGALVVSTGGCYLAGKIFAAHRAGFAASPMCPLFMPHILVVNAVSFGALALLSTLGLHGEAATAEQIQAFDRLMLLASVLLVARLALVSVGPERFGGVYGCARNELAERPWQIVLACVAGAVDLAIVHESLAIQRGAAWRYAAWIIGLNKGVLVADVGRLLNVSMWGGSILEQATGEKRSAVAVLYSLWGFFGCVAGSGITILLMGQVVTGVGFCALVTGLMLGIFAKTGARGEPTAGRVGALLGGVAIPLGVIYYMATLGAAWWVDPKLEAPAALSEAVAS